MLKIMMALVLGVQYWDYHICVMGTESLHNTAGWLIPSLLFPVLLFAGLGSLSRSLFPLFTFGFPLSSAACSCLLIQWLLVISTASKYAHNLFVPPDRRFLSCLCCISLERQELALELSQSLVCYFFRYGYNCVIYGWDPACMMGHEWIRNMNVHSLPHGPHQPFYNVLVEDGSCRYAAQGE